MEGLLKSEGKLFYSKWLLRSIATVFGLAILGMIMHAIIINISVDEDLTVTYLGTFLATVGAICVGIMLATNMHYRFKMLITMGQKRGDIVLCENVYVLLFTLMNYGFSMVVLLIESNLYTIIYKGIPLDEEFLFAFQNFPKYSWLVIFLLTAYFRFLITLSEKYGMKVYTIGYLGFAAVIIGLSRLLEIEKVLQVFRNMWSVLSTVPGVLWIALGLAVGVVLMMIYDKALIRMNV